MTSNLSRETDKEWNRKKMWNVWSNDEIRGRQNYQEVTSSNTFLIEFSIVNLNNYNSEASWNGVLYDQDRFDYLLACGTVLIPQFSCNTRTFSSCTTHENAMSISNIMTKKIKSNDGIILRRKIILIIFFYKFFDYLLLFSLFTYL